MQGSIYKGDGVKGKESPISQSQYNKSFIGILYSV